ncbi:MAG: hypothetical protein UC961_07315, partial [Emergencia sp.]|nr:hypothetical protein [Emergencia sp.]
LQRIYRLKQFCPDEPAAANCPAAIEMQQTEHIKPKLPNAASGTHQAEAVGCGKQNTTNRLGKQAAAGIHNQLNHVLYRLEELL